MADQSGGGYKDQDVIIARPLSIPIHKGQLPETSTVNVTSLKKAIVESVDCERKHSRIGEELFRTEPITLGRNPHSLRKKGMRLGSVAK